MPEIKNLKKAVKRIKKAVKNKEKIILYGDADLDGVSSVIILKESIKNLGGDIADIYFPDRDKEGYGINKNALKYLSRPAAFGGGPGEKQKRAKLLFVALDCGITNFEEVKFAKKLGFETIIIDHHQVLKKIPEASIVIDPFQKEDKYSFKHLATAGIVFKLSQELLGKNLSETLKRNFLELVALATLADMMPREQDNQEFIKEGLISLKTTFRPGLKVFWEKEFVKDVSLPEAAQKIISIFNISEPTPDHLNQAYLILTNPNQKKAKEIIEKVLEQSREKGFRIKEITEEVLERTAKKPEEPIVFEGDSSWSSFLVGAVASRVYNRHKKPIFAYSKKQKESQGSVRTPKDIDAVQLMTKCRKYLITYGGHPRAAGFRLKNENLEKFKTCLIKTIQQMD